MSWIFRHLAGMRLRCILTAKCGTIPSIAHAEKSCVWRILDIIPPGRTEQIRALTHQMDSRLCGPIFKHLNSYFTNNADSSRSWLIQNIMGASVNNEPSLDARVSFIQSDVLPNPVLLRLFLSCVPLQERNFDASSGKLCLTLPGTRTDLYALALERAIEVALDSNYGD